MQDLSFEQNEALVFNLAQKGKSTSNQPVRPKLQPRSKGTFDDDQPTKEKIQLNQSKNVTSDQTGPGITRQKINIDENDDTFHNQEEFKRVIERGKRLKERMNEALDEDAWRQLHGPHEIPKTSYINPFSPQLSQDREPQTDQYEAIYSMEIEAGLQKNQEEPIVKNLVSAKPQTTKEMMSAVDDLGTAFGGNGGNLSEMKFIRLKVKTLNITDTDILQQMTADGFSITVSLPLADIYQKTVSMQTVKLSNYDIISMNEFEFQSLSLYNFKISEETFSQLAQSDLTIQIDGFGAKGSLLMGKLLLAPNFQLKTTVNLGKSLDNQEKKKVDKKLTKQKSAIVAQVTPSKFIPTGSISIELNLQQGDTEEELMRNYKIKLSHQEEYQRKAAEIEALEKRKRAIMQMEQQPTFAQLYLHIDKLTHGGIQIDRDGNLIQNPHPVIFQDQDGQNQQQQIEQSENAYVYPPRNIYIQYKSFPTFEKLVTSVQFGKSEPEFNHRSQFPILMSPTVVDNMERFTYVFEVWDSVSPGKDELVGLVKVPLSSFCYSLRTTEHDIFSLNFLADQHSKYPMVIVDDDLPIYSPKHGLNVGYLKLMMGLGSPIQVNRQIDREQEFENQKKAKRIAEERARMQAELMMQMARQTAGGNQIGQEDKLQRMIEEQEDKRKREEEEALNRNPLMSLFSGSPGMGGRNQVEKFANALRQSLQSNTGNQDYDIRSNNLLNSLRKLFEEVRASPDLRDLNGEEIFGQEVRTFTGEVAKDDFIFCILDKEQFTLTRTEANNICQLMLHINPYKDDKDRIDIDELQYSLVAYTKYYDLISSRVADLLEKIKLAVCKRIDEPAEVEALCEAIMEASTDSKILPKELRKILEDQYNVVLRETLYDQLQSYFDLDRSGVIYISSVVQYLLDPALSQFNFFKVNPNIITSHITEYVRNCISNRQEEQLLQLETSFINSIAQAKSANEAAVQETNKKQNKKQINDKTKDKKQELVDTEPAGLLLHERINAKLFQHVLKKQGIALSLWEIFTLFEYLNTQICKQVFYEPQRYHAILWEHFYTLVTGRVDYREDVNQRVKQEAKNQKQKAKKQTSALQAVKATEISSDQSSDIMAFSEQDQSDSETEDAAAIDGQNKGDKYKQRKRDEKKPHTQIKHVFDINVKSLQQIPILDKFIRDSEDFERNSKKDPFKSTYIQNIALKYSFPLDEDEIFESDYIRRNVTSDEDHKLYDFEVSMNTVHTYKINRSDSIKTHLKKGTTQLFNVQVVLFQSNQEFVIGNAQLPLEDLLDLVNDYENCTNTYVRKTDTALMKRVVFIYGTSYSQRENCIIGKVSLEISYGAIRQILTKREAADIQFQKGDDQSCYMHRETYINRKIPLNALLSVYVDRVSNIKEAIENIEHFAKINNIVEEKTIQLPTQKVDRRKILTQILKKGLNLQVLTSVFQEDETLKERFKTAAQQSRILHNSLCPVFAETYQLPVQMDTKIFDYLKTKRAVFEVRHYLHQSSAETSQSYFTLGFVKVPLLSLITKNNGIEGEFMILDDYKQKMGSLRLRINLNHHDLQRPLFQGTNKVGQETKAQALPRTLIAKSLRNTTNVNAQSDLERHSHNFEQEFILVLNFCELIMRLRSDLLRADTATNSLYLQFKLGNETYKTKFIPLTNQENIQSHTKKLQLMTFQVNRTILLNVDFNNTQEVEEMFQRPLEVQLWHKVTAEQRYAQPSHEELLGSFFLELNELPKHQNRRLRSESSIVCHEGYFSMYDFKNEKISHERLGCKLLLIPKRDEEQFDDLDRVFNTLVYVGDQDKITHLIYNKLDPQQKGYAELEELSTLVQEQIGDKRTALTLQTLIAENLEYKNSDNVYYSPFFCLPPPYFKYSNDLDSIEIISKIYNELSAIDLRQEGLVPLSMLKQVVVDKLAIKQKIFDDIAEQMQPNYLDVNIKTNNLNPSQIDFVLLIRKMVKALPKVKDIEPEVATQSLKLNVQIESAMRLKNPVNLLEPPNTFVRVRSPFEGSLCNIETKVVNQSCYPYWLGQNFKIEFPLTQTNLQKMQSMQLEFEVYHQISNKHGKAEGEKLIGVAYVDISPLYYVNASETSRMISGYYHVVDRNLIQNSQQLVNISTTSMGNMSFGQLKVTISVDRELLQSEIKVQKLDESNQLLLAQQTFGGNRQLKFNEIEEETQEFQSRQNVLRSTLKPAESKFISQTIERIEANMQLDEESLRSAHAQNMSDLDALTKRLQLSLRAEQSPAEVENNLTDFTQTAKYDNQRRSLAGQLQIAKNNMVGVLNPFESKINEHSEEDFDDQVRSEGNDSFAREQE